MTVRALKKLRAMNYASLYICNRTQTKAEALADEFEINVVPINQLKDIMRKVDVIYCATNTSEPIITVEGALQLSKQTLLIDVGVPRNVAAECSSYCQLITIDQLEAVAKETVDKRAADKQKIDAILEDEKSVFLNWYAYKQVHS